MRQLLNEASSDEDESESKSSRILTGEQGSPGPQLFYDPNQRLDLLTLHPPTAQMIAMGNIFFSRFDPVFKVLHRPSTLAFLYSATRDKKCITRGQEALLFAIYFAAITTVSDQDCINHFGQNKSILVQRYRSGIEAALPNANYLDTDDITVLQALVIYLVRLEPRLGDVIHSDHSPDEHERLSRRSKTLDSVRHCLQNGPVLGIVY